MEKIRPRIEISFSTKVVLPVIGAMVLVMAITVWLVNHRITQQFQDDAVRSLAHADAVLRYSHQKHAENLLLPFRHVPKEPRYKAAAQAAEQNELETLKQLFEDLLTERNADVILFTSDRLESCGASRDALFSLADFHASCASVAGKALHGEIKSDTIRVGEKLFEVVSIPLTGVGDSIVGALTFGQEIGNTTAHEFGLFTRNQVVLLANGHVIASTIPGPELNEQFVRLFTEAMNGTSRLPPARGVKDVLVGDHHYYYAAGRFESLSGDGELGYILLSSYEQPLRALRMTQQLLVICSGLAILIGATVVWWLVRKATEPLRELRNSAEAVGQGDFSQRVKVVSRDECGELAQVFNQMTEKLKRSRDELETMVETLKTTQTQLVQSEKLSGIGEFVAGVAHELNNPLTTVMGFSELLEQGDKDPQHKRHLEMIRKSAQRCHKIVQSLLSFARRRPAERKVSNMNELIEGAVDFLQYQLRTSNVEVACRLSPDLPKTLVDPHQVQQVFLNLLNNARQAIEAHQPSGCIWITTEAFGETVRIVIHDNGPGIPEANLVKVFDPFFTTKEVGKGTGLGLSLCYGIVKEHGGTINVRSKIGEGATFTLEFPATRQSEESPGQPPNAAIRLPPGREGLGKKVLVIDDEETILQMVRDTLSEEGYQVDTASDGETALNRLQQIPYDLALCDWKMPGLNGQQIYERVRACNPEMSNRMVFFTGDVINEKAQKFLKQAQMVCLAKPFSLAEFRSAIGQAVSKASWCAAPR